MKFKVKIKSNRRNAVTHTLCGWHGILWCNTIEIAKAAARLHVPFDYKWWIENGKSQVVYDPNEGGQE